MKIQFYYVDDKYIDFLKQYEQNIRSFTCVPNVKYANRDKFVYGSVLEINSINFFVPVSSRVGKNPQYNMDIVTDDKKNRIKGALRFPYMIPVPSKCLVMLDIKKIPDNNEKIRISKELAFCRRNKDKIEKFALRAYEDIVNSKNDKLVSNSCDFKLLEQAYIEYCIANKLECPQISVQDNALKKLNEVYTDFLNNTKIDNNAHNDFVTQHGELPQTLDTAENRGNVSKYIVEQLDKGIITASERESLKKLKQAILEAEEPLFIQKVNDIAEWAEAVQEKHTARMAELDEQEKKRNNSER